ncbi:MAG TPA: GAF domain-containing protein [Myxococcota bacterium]
MTKESNRYEDYVHRVRDNIQKYLDEIIEENEKLHSLVGALEAELSAHKNEAVAAKEELGRQCAERDELEKQIDAIRREHEDISNRYHDIERQNNDLANLYVASYRLHESLNRDEVLSVIQEIVINMIGSEELAIFERQNGELKLAASHGVDLERLERDCQAIGRVRELAEEVMRSGERYLADSGEGAGCESNLTACVPLRFNNESMGAIAVFRLLGHKPRLEPLDLELFDLLASHAAVALQTSKLAAR